MNAVRRPDQSPRLRPDACLRLDIAACLPGRYPGTRCERCAEACPIRVLTLPAAIDGPRGPQLAEGCLACGRCVAVCPTEALHVPGFPTVPKVAPEAARGPLAIDCWRVPLGDSRRGALRVPCLGGLTPAWLLERVGENDDQGVALLDRGFCDRCPAGGPEHPAARSLAETERILDALEVPATRWPRLVPQPLPPRRMEAYREEPLLEGRLSRRSFLTGAGRAATPLSDAVGADGPSAPRMLEPQPQVRRRFIALKRMAPTPVLPASLFPTLTASTDCANHRLCVAACPTGAIQDYRVEGARGIRFDAAACVACGLCTQLCPGQALTLHTAGDAADAYPGPQPLTRFALRTCPDCGAEHPDDGPICPACLKDQSFARDAFRTLFGAAAR